MTPQHHQPAAADPAEAAARAAPLKPIMDRIDTRLDEILKEIAALKEIVGAPPRQHASPLPGRCSSGTREMEPRSAGPSSAA